MTTAKPTEGMLDAEALRLSDDWRMLLKLKDEFDIAVHFCEKCGEADPLKEFDCALMLSRYLRTRAALTGTVQPVVEALTNGDIKKLWRECGGTMDEYIGRERGPKETYRIPDTGFLQFVVALESRCHDVERAVARRLAFSVKPLEWNNGITLADGQTVWSAIAEGMEFTYSIWTVGERFSCMKVLPQFFDSLEEAKEAVQQNYDERILSALVATPPVPTSAADEGIPFALVEQVENRIAYRIALGSTPRAIAEDVLSIAAFSKAQAAPTAKGWQWMAPALLSALDEHGLTVRDAASAIGCSHSTISRICRGEAPDIDNYFLVANWLAAQDAPATPAVPGEMETEALQVGLNLLLLAETVRSKNFHAIRTEIAAQQLEQADKFIQRLAAHPLPKAPIDAGHGWQPIETAPTNRAILVHIPDLDYYGNDGVYAGMLVDMGTGKRWMTFGWAIGRDLGTENAPVSWRAIPATSQARAK